MIDDALSPRPRLAVAMSGGVDSAVAAALLLEQGFPVFGVTLRLFDGVEADRALSDAASVAARLGIEHHILDARARFKTCVVDPFFDSYLAARTPNPCVACNRAIKFGDLFAFARDKGASFLATGHYVKEGRDETGAPALFRGADPRRDQSYFLFALDRAVLPFVRFPLGACTKDQVRARAHALGLAVAERKDSQDICFVPEGDYAKALALARPGTLRPGLIVDEKGQALGKHAGLAHFTVGQRKGLDLGVRKGEHNAPLYVLRLEAQTQNVVVGPREALARREVPLERLNWQGPDDLTQGVRGLAQLRAAQKPLSAVLTGTPGGSGRLVFDAPVYGVAAGQAGVLYRGDRLLGGGWIA